MEIDESARSAARTLKERVPPGATSTDEVAEVERRRRDGSHALPLDKALVKDLWGAAADRLNKGQIIDFTKEIELLDDELSRIEAQRRPWNQAAAYVNSIRVYVHNVRRKFHDSSTIGECELDRRVWGTSSDLDDDSRVLDFTHAVPVGHPKYPMAGLPEGFEHDFVFAPNESWDDVERKVLERMRECQAFVRSFTPDWRLIRFRRGILGGALRSYLLYGFLEDDAPEIVHPYLAQQHALLLKTNREHALEWIAELLRRGARSVDEAYRLACREAKDGVLAVASPGSVRNDFSKRRWSARSLKASSQKYLEGHYPNLHPFLAADDSLSDQNHRL